MPSLPAAQHRRRSYSKLLHGNWGHWVGIALLAAWTVWWSLSISDQRLVGVDRMVFGAHPAYGFDFQQALYRPTRIWSEGGDPYEECGIQFPYPPTVLRLFYWTRAFSLEQAMAIWVVALAAMAMLGAVTAWFWRRQLQLAPVPVTLVVAGILWSSPVVFAMERGNFDLISIPIIVSSLALLRLSDSKLAGVLSGAILAISPWAKLYPGIMLVGLVALRRRVVLASFVLAGCLIGWSIWDEMPGFFWRNQEARDWIGALTKLRPHLQPNPWSHGLAASWPRIWLGSPLPQLAHIPGSLAASVMLLPVMGWVSLRIYRCPQRTKLDFPYLFWLVALGTFVPTIANDYSLAFLPIAAVAVWSRCDNKIVQFMLAASLLCWQPFLTPLPGGLVLLLKYAALLAVGVCLVERASELTAGSGEVEQVGGRHQPDEPSIARAA